MSKNTAFCTTFARFPSKRLAVLIGEARGNDWPNKQQIVELQAEILDITSDTVNNIIQIIEKKFQNICKVKNGERTRAHDTITTLLLPERTSGVTLSNENFPTCIFITSLLERIRIKHTNYIHKVFTSYITDLKEDIKKYGNCSIAFDNDNYELALNESEDIILRYKPARDATPQPI